MRRVTAAIPDPNKAIRKLGATMAQASRSGKA
jgi:hypothetical protein